MITHWHYALSVGLLALYLLVLARWHSGRSPRVVSGPADFALLTFGLGGIALFGPFGQVLARWLFVRPNALDWLSLASGMTLAALLVSRRAWRRLIVYHVDAITLDRALDEALAEKGGRFQRTIHGFEDPILKSGIRVETSARWWTATIEAYGQEPERLIHALETRLDRRFRTVTVPPSRIGGLFLGSSAVLLVMAAAGWLWTQPQARAAFRDWLERIPGG